MVTNHIYDISQRTLTTSHTILQVQFPMGRSENDAARRWHQPERKKLIIQPAVASRPARIPHRNNETSSQPANDLGGVPAMYDSFGKASARWGYVAVKPPAACNMPWLRKEPVGAAWQIRQKNMITSAGIRRIAVRLMLDFRTLEGNMSRFSLEKLPSVMTVDEVSSVLGICSKTCCKLIREKQLHGVKVGRSYRIAKSELFRFLKVLPNDREEHRSSQYQTDIFREG